MELIASLRDQLVDLCARPSVDPNWILSQLSQGLRDRYGRLAVGFARRSTAAPEAVRLLGFADFDGRLLVPMSDDFQPDRRHPAVAARTLRTEAWIDARALGPWRVAEVDACFAAARAAFLTPWLVDRPTDWYVLVLSAIAPPGGMSQDRGLSVTANLLATNLLRALDARRLARANAWIEREMAEIARLQALLQPAPGTRIAGIDVAFSSRIYQYAGGDYFDLPVLTHLAPARDRVSDHDHWGAIIADVSGHGPSAAVEAAMLDAILRTYPGPIDRGPAAVAAYLNRYLFTRRPRAAFISAFIANFDPRRRLLRYVCCGHPRPLFRNRAGQVEELDVVPGIPLRIERDAVWEAAERRVAVGETLLLFTDGVIETRGPDGGPLGMAGLRALFASVPPAQPAAAVLAALREGILAHQGGRPPQDDETLIVLQFLP